MSGVVTGGWEFVWAAYGLTFSILVIYVVSVVSRYRQMKGRVERDERLRTGVNQ